MLFGVIHDIGKTNHISYIGQYVSDNIRRKGYDCFFRIGKRHSCSKEMISIERCTRMFIRNLSYIGNKEDVL